MSKTMEATDNTDYVQATFLNGLKAGLPIGLGYLIVSFTFGMTACLNGFTPFEAIFMSMSNVTSAGQFAGMQLINAHATYLELMVTVGIINIRYLLMSAVLSQKLSDKMTLLQRFLISFGVTDEIFTVALVEVKEVTFTYFVGLFTLPYLGWSLGTVFGSLMDNILNPHMQSAASIALYCMFIALVLPPSKHHKDIRFVVILTVVFRVVMTITPVLNKVSTGYSIIFCALVAAFIGAIKFKPSNDMDKEVL